MIIDKEPLQIGCLYEPGAGVGVCGDWLHGDRLEGAFLSGRALAARILGTHSPS